MWSKTNKGVSTQKSVVIFHWNNHETKLCDDLVFVPNNK